MSESETRSLDTAQTMKQLYLDRYASDVRWSETHMDASRARKDARWELNDAISGSGRGYEILTEGEKLLIGEKFAKARVLKVIHERADRDESAAWDALNDFFSRNAGRPVIATNLRVDTPSFYDFYPNVRSTVSSMNKISGNLTGYWTTDSFGISVKEKRILLPKTALYIAQVLNDKGKIITSFEFPESG